MRHPVSKRVETPAARMLGSCHWIGNVVDLEEVDASSQKRSANEEPEPRVLWQDVSRVFQSYYYLPITQVTMLGFICFMCPGLYNALNGLGGGGRVDTETNSNANASHYATFAFFAFFAGSIHNVLGPRLTLLLGSIGYTLNVAAYLATNIHPRAGAFIIVAGVIQGICAGLLWTAQGSLMLAYSTERQKGLFISIFWTIFNVGSVVGASISLGQNFHSKANAVGNGTYIGFLVLTLIGVFIPLLMANPSKMVRSDGSKVVYPRHPSWLDALRGLWATLKTNPWVILLFPMFFASNWFYTWQFNDYNSALFNIRARSLNNLVYWIAQILGSVSIARLLDSQRLSRRTRAFSGWSVLFALVFIVHIWAYFYQRGYTRENASPTAVKLDIHDIAYVGRIWLYIFCGLLDSMWQTTVYWLIGSMSNDPATLAHFVGFYKSIQSAGAAGVWRADGVGLPYMNIFVSTWALLVVGLLLAFPVIHIVIKDGDRVSDTDLEVPTSTQKSL